ncbi:MAG: YicC family protein [Deltaproteobacteria bacterium]|nr:YicC family protein [Deltaproteobacteria bacterium]
MVKSMTGYGRSDFSIGGDVYSLEAKSLNHRFIDISLRMPERISVFEGRIREEIKKRFSRGAFSVFVSATSVEAPALKINLPMAKAYIEAAADIRKEFGLGGELDAPAILKLKDIFSLERKAPVSEADWDSVKTGFDMAFGQLEDWRKKEGAALKSDLLGNLETIEGLLFSVEARAPKVLESYRQRLWEEMEKFLKDRVDESRILLEAAVFADRTAISEEIVRLKSHLDMFRQFLRSEEPVGKRLDFLCQEIGREVNTIGSKPSDVQITQVVVEMKGEIEKIREQVQNIE